jgi:UDP-GlcNAc:undecaprenyl-phosphate GlcNAc-1-phosphate transferase
MRTAIVAFVLACLVSVLLTPLVRRVALARRLFDDPRDARKVHGRPIPRLGGVAIAAGFYAPLLGLLIQGSGVGTIFYAVGWKAFGFMAGGVAICLLGLYDDIHGAGAKEKFIVQFGIAAGLYFLGFRMDVISLPFAGTVALGVLALPFTMLWIVGVINAMNLIDGLDGLAAGVALCAVLTTFTISTLRGDPLMMLYMGALGGATLGFLVYNFNPASIFMGDTGSMFLGYVLGVGAIQASQKSSTTVAIIVPMLALGLPITDTLAAMTRRLLTGRPMFSADRGHIHHRLLDLGLSQKQAVLILYGASALFGGVALFVTFASGVQVAVILLALVTIAFIAMRRIGYGRLAAGTAGAPTSPQFHSLARAADEAQLWRELRSAVRELRLSAIRVSVHGQEDGEPTSLVWSQGVATGDNWATRELTTSTRTGSVLVEYRTNGPQPAATLAAFESSLSTCLNAIYGSELDSAAHHTGQR